MDIKTLVLETLSNNEEFQGDYCLGCKEWRHIPCEFDFTDECCAKFAIWQEIEALAEAMAETVGE